MTTKQQDEIAELKAELEKVKAALAPPPDDRAAIGAWKDQMCELAERRMSLASPFSRADLAAFDAAAPTSVVKDIALRDARAPTGRPGMIPSSQTVSGNVSGPPVATSGWRNASTLTPPPGVAQADRLMAAEDREFRRQRIIEEAERRALMKATEEPK
jgi:hypothetical protein